MKTRLAGLMAVLSIVNIWAEPGGIYTLTGNEKGIAEIIKADMAKYPDLYKGETLNCYMSKFKRENKIGKKKLSPGDVLCFPQTLASLKLKRDRAKSQASNVANGAFVLLNPTNEYKKECWKKIQTSLEEAGFVVKVDETEQLREIEAHGANIFIRILARKKEVELNRDESETNIHYYSDEGRLLAEALENELCKRTSPRCSASKNSGNIILKQDIPSVIIIVSAKDAYKYSQRYSRAITDGITEFIEENPQ